MVTDTPSDSSRFTWPQTDPDDSSIVIPAPGAYYPGWEDIRSKEPQVTKVSPTFFNVEVRYGNVDSTGAPSDDDWASNPLTKPAEERWGNASTIEEISQDARGLPYINWFGQVANNERAFVDVVLTLTRNEAAYNKQTSFDWHHTIYDGAFRDVPRGRVLMGFITADHVKDEVIDSLTFGDILYSKVTYEIFFRYRNIPLINGWEVTKGGPGVLFVSIEDTEANQDKYAW